MSTSYEFESVHKFAEVDNYSQGGQGSADVYAYKYKESSSTIAGILQVFADHVGVDVETLDLTIGNDCDNPGRVDACRIENAEGEEPTQQELADWKEGKIDLYNVVYTVYIREVTRKPVDFSNYKQEQ